MPGGDRSHVIEKAFAPEELLERVREAIDRAVEGGEVASDDGDAGGDGEMAGKSALATSVRLTGASEASTLAGPTDPA